VEQLTPVTLPKPGKSPLRFKDLATLSGALRFSRALGGTEEDTVRVQQLAKNYLADNKSIGDIEIGRVPSGAVYDTLKDRIGVSSADVDVLAHETEHALRLRGTSNLYRTVLGLSKQVVALNNMAAVPAILGLRAMIKNKEERNSVLRVLAGASAVAAVPNLVEEGMASTRVVLNSPDKAKAFKRLFPAFAQHAGYGMVAPGLYLAGTKVEDLL